VLGRHLQTNWTHSGWPRSSSRVHRIANNRITISLILIHLAEISGNRKLQTGASCGSWNWLINSIKMLSVFPIQNIVLLLTTPERPFLNYLQWLDEEVELWTSNKSTRFHQINPYTDLGPDGMLSSNHLSMYWYQYNFALNNPTDFLN